MGGGTSLVSVYNVICLHHHAPVRTVGQGEGITPLMYCCHARGSLDCAQALLRGGAKVDQKLVSAPAFVVGAASPLLRLATGCFMRVCVCLWLCGGQVSLAVTAGREDLAEVLRARLTQ